MHLNKEYGQRLNGSQLRCLTLFESTPARLQAAVHRALEQVAAVDLLGAVAASKTSCAGQESVVGIT